MLFNSLEFFVFFPIVVALYYLMPHKYRWALLLLASCYFYMVFVPVYILILGFTIVVDYFAGMWLEDTHGKGRKWLLIASIIANTGVLAVFKYYNFLNENLTVLLHGVNFQNPIPYLSILLPIGLSFHTLQADDGNWKKHDTFSYSCHHRPVVRSDDRCQNVSTESGTHLIKNLSAFLIFINVKLCAVSSKSCP